MRNGVQRRSSQILIQRVRQTDGLRGQRGGEGLAIGGQNGSGGGQGWGGGHGERWFVDPQTLLKNRRYMVSVRKTEHKTVKVIKYVDINIYTNIICMYIYIYIK